LIQNYVEIDTELADAELMMPENDPNLFEEEIDEPADELVEQEMIEQEFYDIIPSNQLDALQEIEEELHEFENSRAHIGRMPFRDLGVQQERMETEPESNSPTYFVLQPAQLPTMPPPPPIPRQQAAMPLSLPKVPGAVV